MRTNLLSTLFISCATLLISQQATAQSMGHFVTKNIVNENRAAHFMAVSDFTSEVPAKTIEDKKEYANDRSQYYQSEQFVFDNLSVLKNKFSIADIYFDLDKAEIREDAKPILENLVTMMMENPEIMVAANSYTDSRVSAYNEKMSAARAQAAIDYLVTRGIGADRLIIEKHGRPAQANPCNGDAACSLATQQLNRRTEFNVVYNGVNLGQTF